MNQQVSITGPHRWQPGESGNAKGRPVGARQRISEKLLGDLAAVWETHGRTVLEKLATDDPAKLAQIAYGLLPKDVFIRVEEAPPGNLDPAAWAQLRRVLDLIERCAPAGAEPMQIFETIEAALVRRYALPAPPY